MSLSWDVGSCTSVPEICVIVISYFVLVFYFIFSLLCFLFPFLLLQLPRIRPTSLFRLTIRSNPSSSPFCLYYAARQGCSSSPHFCLGTASSPDAQPSTSGEDMTFFQALYRRGVWGWNYLEETAVWRVSHKIIPFQNLQNY